VVWRKQYSRRANSPSIGIGGIESHEWPSWLALAREGVMNAIGRVPIRTEEVQNRWCKGPQRGIDNLFIAKAKSTGSSR
jgi:hypothetical protein